MRTKDKSAILTELKKRGWSVSLGEFTTGLLFKREAPGRFFTWRWVAEQENIKALEAAKDGE